MAVVDVHNFQIVDHMQVVPVALATLVMKDIVLRSANRVIYPVLLEPVDAPIIR